MIVIQLIKKFPVVINPKILHYSTKAQYWTLPWASSACFTHTQRVPSTI